MFVGPKEEFEIDVLFSTWSKKSLWNKMALHLLHQENLNEMLLELMIEVFIRKIILICYIMSGEFKMSHEFAIVCFKFFLNN